MQQRIAVIDPGVKEAEIDCFRGLAALTKIPLTYHLPVLREEALPPVDDHLKGAIILGSNSSVHDNFPWQVNLRCWLESLFSRRVPLFGICFGHQLVAHHLGGRVEFLNSEQKKRVGILELEMLDTPFSRASKRGLFYSHNEVVTEVPREMLSWSKPLSKESGIESLAHSTLPVWTTQAHPEATVSFAAKRGVLLTADQLRDGWELLSDFLEYCESK